MPGGYQGACRVPGCPQGAGDARRVRGCLQGTGMTTGYQDARRIPECSQGTRMPAGYRVPGLRRGSGATSWAAAASRRRAGSGPAAPGLAGGRGRHRFVGPEEQKLCSAAPALADRVSPSVWGGWWSSSLRGRRALSTPLLRCATPPWPILPIFSSFAASQRHTCSSAPLPAARESWRLQRKWFGAELAAQFLGNVSRPSHRDRLGLYCRCAGK